MSANVSPENERFIQSLVATGSYPDRAAALDASVDLLRLRNELLERIEVGRRQLDEGEFTEYDDASLTERFRQLKEHARRAAGHHG